MQQQQLALAQTPFYSPCFVLVVLVPVQPQREKPPPLSQLLCLEDTEEDAKPSSKKIAPRPSEISIKELVKLAFQGDTQSRAAQLAVKDDLGPEDAARAVHLLDADRAARCPFANYFLQELIVQHAASAVPALLEVLGHRVGAVASMGRHPYGCRVLCRVAERVVPGSAGERILMSVLQLNFVKSQFGRYVAITCLGKSTLAAAVLAAVWKDPWAVACSRWGVLVMEYAVKIDDALARVLVQDEKRFAKLSRTKEGRFLQRAAMGQS